MLVQNKARYLNHQCEHCSYKADGMMKIQLHLKSYRGRVYECDRCDFTACTTQLLGWHTKRVHYGVSKRRVRSSNVRSNNERSRREDETNPGMELVTWTPPPGPDGGGGGRQKEIFKCEFCLFESKRQSKVENHMKVHRRVNKPYFCALCDFKTSDPNVLKNHVVGHQTSSKRELAEKAAGGDICDNKKKLYICPCCDTAFNKASHLKEHLRVVHPAASKTLDQLIQASIIKDEPSSVEEGGRIREKSFPAKGVAYRKRNTDHSRSSRMGNAHEGYEDPTSTAHKGSPPRRRKLIRRLRHIKGSHHSGPSSRRRSPSEEFEESPTIPTTIKRENKFQPPPRRPIIKRPIFKRHGNNIKNFICKFCSRNLTSKFNLSEHVRVHTGEKPYSCPRCSYKSSHRFYMYSHMSRRHQLSIRLQAV